MICKMEIFEYHHTVAENEIDVQGHTNNVEYIRWFQDAAIAHSSHYGWTPDRYVAFGQGWVAKSHTIEYIRPSFAGDEIVVQTTIVSKRHVAYTRAYRILRRSDSELLAKGETVWAFIDYSTGRPIRIPDLINDAFPDASTFGQVA
jgi:acyl-CoA thioester hydrolase